MSNGWVSGAWAAAERIVFKRLLTICQGVEGTNAFLGSVPVGSLNTWSLAVSGGGGGEITWNNPPVSVNVNALISGIFEDRARALGLAELLVASLPILADGHVQCFRLQEFPTVGVDYIPIADDRELRVYVVRAPALCVFDGARYVPA